MSYGGSRSGKTFGICRAMILRACKTKSRHLAVRLKFNHAKTSLWYETFSKVFDMVTGGCVVGAVEGAAAAAATTTTTTTVTMRGREAKRGGKVGSSVQL